MISNNSIANYTEAKTKFFGHIKIHQTLEKLIQEGKEKGQRNTKRSWEKDVEDWMGQVSGDWDEQQKIG